MSNYPFSPDSSLMTPASGPERVAAVVAHSAIFWGPILVPLAVWLLYPMVQPNAYYVREQAMQALLWHMFTWIIGGALWTVTWILWALILIGWPFAVVLTVISAAFSIWTFWIALVATWKAFQGAPYRLPIVGSVAR